MSLHIGFNCMGLPPQDFHDHYDTIGILGEQCSSPRLQREDSGGASVIDRSLPPTLEHNSIMPPSLTSVSDPALSFGHTPVVFGPGNLTIEDLLSLARGRAVAVRSDKAIHRERLERSATIVQQIDRSATEVYGVTTGVGASVETHIPRAFRDEAALNLVHFHGVGTGRILTEIEAAAVIAARLASLSRGHSGVRLAVFDRLARLLNDRMLPRIPAEGSVGASGDLTPLSYVAAMLVGEREVTLRGEPMSASVAHARIGLTPIELRPKESLAMMNGTSVMTGLSCIAYERARAFATLASSVTAIVSEAIHGNPQHFDDRIFALKPHPGSRACATFLRSHLADDRPRNVARLQDRYSIRCAPHVIGVLLDALSFGRDVLEIELNGVSDNPLIDAEAGEVLHGGNFYGGHVCFVMDSLKGAVASVADLLDRQLVLLCMPDTSDGLPANLVGVTGQEAVANNGFKAMQISASALVAEAQKLAMPASAFSRSTESHNQDKVSMGTIAARDCLRVVELAETVASIGLLAAAQAVELRGMPEFSPRTRELVAFLRRHVQPVKADRRQDLDIDRTLSLHREGALPMVGRGEALDPSRFRGASAGNDPIAAITPGSRSSPRGCE